MRTGTRRKHRGRASDAGASAVEYGLMLAAITAVIVVAVFAFGHVLNNSFTQSQTCMANATNRPSTFTGCPNP